MSSSSPAGSKGGVGFLGALTIVFVIAKLWGKIDWSWIWVFSPVLIPFAIVISLLILLGVYLGVDRIIYQIKTTPEQRQTDRIRARAERELQAALSRLTR